MEQVLLDSFGIAMRAYKVNSCHDIPSALFSLYSTQSCTEVGSEDPFHLIVIFDDPLHPAIEDMYDKFASSDNSAVSSGLSVGVMPVVEMCIAFDSISVVPCRELQQHALVMPNSTPNKQLPPSSKASLSAELVDAKVAKLLSYLHQQFDSCGSSTTSLLCPMVSQVG